MHFVIISAEAYAEHGCRILQVQTQLANHIAAIGPAIVIGAVCGLLAIVFTALNLKIARLRRRVMQVLPCFVRNLLKCCLYCLCSCA